VDEVSLMLFVASYSYNQSRANTHATVIKFSFGCLLKSQVQSNILYIIEKKLALEEAANESR